jgi:hypothetical protein
MQSEQRPHHANFIIVNDGVQTMCDGEDCLVLKLFAYELLDTTISVNINARSRFIHQQNLRTAKHGTSPLTDTERIAAF